MESSTSLPGDLLLRMRLSLNRDFSGLVKQTCSRTRGSLRPPPVRSQGDTLIDFFRPLLVVRHDLLMEQGGAPPESPSSGVELVVKGL